MDLITDLTPAAVEARLRYANALSEATIIPDVYRGQPANVLVAIETGTALGIPPTQALQSLISIKGRVTMSADLMAAVVRRAGHRLRVLEHDGKVTAEIVRADDPDFTYRVTWDRAKAERAGLWGQRGPWSQYPGQMLRSRAVTEVCRQAASDALMGVTYAPEELGAEVDEDGTVIGAEPAAAPPVAAPESGRRRMIRQFLAANGGIDDGLDEVLAAAEAAGACTDPQALAAWLEDVYGTRPADHKAAIDVAVPPRPGDVDAETEEAPVAGTGPGEEGR
jgi:hypothetical protein